MQPVNTRLMIAGGIVGLVATMFFAAYLMNCITQVKTTGHYIVPPELIQVFQVCLTTSITVLGWGVASASKEKKRALIKKNQIWAECPKDDCGNYIPSADNSKCLNDTPDPNFGACLNYKAAEQTKEPEK